MLPEFGGGLSHYLFQANTPATRRLMEERIVQALQRWEPRIELERVTVEPDLENPSGVTVDIQYRLVSDGHREHMTFSMRLGSES